MSKLRQNFDIFFLLFTILTYLQGTVSATNRKNTLDIRRIKTVFLIKIDKITKLLTIRVADGTLAPFWQIFYNFYNFWQLVGPKFAKSPLSGQFCAINFLQLFPLWNHRDDWQKAFFHKISRENAAQLLQFLAIFT